jgi:hypothetical protein
VDTAVEASRGVRIIFFSTKATNSRSYQMHPGELRSARLIDPWIADLRSSEEAGVVDHIYRNEFDCLEESGWWVKLGAGRIVHPTSASD